MGQLKAAFFTEAGSKRGMGHLTRTYSILETFKKNGVVAKIFLDSDLSYDYKFDSLNYFHWNNFQIDAEYDIIFIDSYEASLHIYEMISKSSQIAVYIDDFARLEYPNGVILNFSPEADKLYLPSKENHTYLLGLKYLPIREILQQVDSKKENQIFIMLGGNDTQNLSITILKSLLDIDQKKVVVNNNADIAQQLKQYPNTKVLYQPNDTVLATYMAQSSLAISTASMSVYELAYLNVPTIIIAVAQNQINGINQFLKYKLAHAFVDVQSNNYTIDLKTKAEELLHFPILSSLAIDGFGTKRVYEKVMNLCKKS